MLINFSNLVISVSIFWETEGLNCVENGQMDDGH